MGREGDVGKSSEDLSRSLRAEFGKREEGAKELCDESIGPDLLAEDEELGGKDDREITWEETLKLLNETGWEAKDMGPFFIKHYAAQISRGFSLKHLPGTSFLHHQPSDITVACCTSGVYGFGTGFEYGYLMSRTNKGALERMLNPQLKSEGPTRRAGSEYDPTKPNVFNDTDESEDGSEEEGDFSDEESDEDYWSDQDSAIHVSS